jgi:NADH-quinone oxidoreductase subunit J
MIPVTDILFYCLSAVLLGAAMAVITAKNPVHSVFFLIVAFFNAAGLFILLGAEYLAMTLVVVYVGAVAVLFLFVVMMLNINFERFRAGFISYLPLGVGVASVLFVEISALLYQSLQGSVPLAPAGSPAPDVDQLSNAAAIGVELYTHYALLFQMAGLILLVAMIGAIVLTLRHRLGVRRQDVSRQNARHPEETVTLVKVKSKQGVKL